jgi:hypothetical protein
MFGAPGTPRGGGGAPGGPVVARGEPVAAEPPSGAGATRPIIASVRNVA